MTLRDVLAPLDSLFRRHRIRYVVIGGYAVAAWGEVRATRDVDILCSAEDLNPLKNALKDAGMRFEHRAGDPEDPISDVIRLEAGTRVDLYEVDVLFGIRDAPAGILERCIRVQIEDLSVPIASPEDTIILKLLGGSARDIDDARSVSRIQRSRLDLSLVRQLCPERLRDTLEKTLAL